MIGRDAEATMAQIAIVVLKSALGAHEAKPQPKWEQRATPGLHLCPIDRNKLATRNWKWHRRGFEHGSPPTTMDDREAARPAAAADVSTFCAVMRVKVNLGHTFSVR